MTRGQSDLRLYLDILPDPSEVGCSPRSPEVLHRLHPRTKNNQLRNAETTMVFLKHFDATKQSLFGIGKVDMPGTSKVDDLVPIINERMKWASETRLKLYEVTNSGLSPT